MALIGVELLLTGIASALESEARLVAGVGDELGALQNELLWMKSFLEDVDARNMSLTETQRRWFDDVTDMAYTAEAIVDDFMYHIRRQQPNAPKYFAKFFYATIGFPKHLWKRRQIARELQKMKRKITDATERKERYSVSVHGRQQEGIRCFQEQQRQRLLQHYSESSLFFKDEQLVGTEDGRDKLLRWLTDADAEPHRTVISVVGIGGSGKTTLVANVYEHPNVKRHFDCRAWITVSQTYDPHHLLKTMIQELNAPTNLSNMSFRKLVEKLVNYLGPKRYVIVLDDVWDINLWTQIRISLPDEGHGSRVLITTRNQDIASSSSFGVQSHVHPVQPLEESEAWELFCRNAFSNLPNKTCPQPLQTIAHDLVAKCQGLPLAIVALGGLMSSKNLESPDWRQVLDAFTWEFSNNPRLDRVRIVLLLSFHELSYRLKCCFLYCCLFPEDYHINKERLTRLWIAEGFVERVIGRRPEDIAESYIVDLVNQNMLQVAVRDVTGKPTDCKMHDILREFALDISKREFCTTSDGTIEVINGAPRLSIQSSIEGALRSWNVSLMKLRTLILFSGSVQTMPHGLKLLRVLDLQFLPIVKLPNELVHLHNLRYLNLRGTQVDELPKSIGRLRNLQTLDITDSKIRVLPKGITKLHNLRHLSAFDFGPENFESFHHSHGLVAHANICKLKQLQILGGVEANPELMKQTRNMRQLTRLAIYNVRGIGQQDLFNSIQSMKLLTHLFVTLSDEDECIQTDALSSAPPCLTVLQLSGKLERVPGWFSSLESLTRLVLHWSRLRDDQDPLQYIQALPNLGELSLINAYTGRQLCFNTGFRKLKVLGLSILAELNEIIIDREVMPDVKQLWLHGCTELKMLPRGIQFLTNLQTLRLVEVSDELIQGIEREGSLDRQNIQHIPDVGYRDRDFNYKKVSM